MAERKNNNHSNNNDSQKRIDGEKSKQSSVKFTLPKDAEIDKDILGSHSSAGTCSKQVVSELDETIKRDRTDTEYESDKGYRKITERIINISSDYLTKQNNNRQPLRNKFFRLFSALLSVQYGVLVVFIVLNSLTVIPFEISTEILKLYIISVFVETLSAMGVMVAFAFASSEETKVVGILNNIVENYQKVKLNNNDPKQ